LGYWLSHLVDWGAQEELNQHRLSQMPAEERAKAKHQTKMAIEFGAQGGKILTYVFLGLGVFLTVVILVVFQLRQRV